MNRLILLVLLFFFLNLIGVALALAHTACAQNAIVRARVLRRLVGELLATRGREGDALRCL